MNTLVQQKDVIFAVIQQCSGKTKTQLPHSRISVWKAQEKGHKLWKDL